MTAEMQEKIAMLDKVLPVVVRVHGGEHSELKEVLLRYRELKAALEQGSDTAETRGALRALTGGYALPEGACEAYTKVYHALAELDRVLS